MCHPVSWSCTCVVVVAFVCCVYFERFTFYNLHRPRVRQRWSGRICQCVSCRVCEGVVPYLCRGDSKSQIILTFSEWFAFCFGQLEVDSIQISTSKEICQGRTRVFSCGSQWSGKRERFVYVHSASGIELLQASGFSNHSFIPTRGLVVYG